VAGDTCWLGLKPIQDYCGNNFECYSRCCSGDTCSDFGECVQTCKVNSDCDNECCSFGYCTSGSLCGTCDNGHCQGRKTEGDVCDSNIECSSLKCVKRGEVTLATLEQDGMIHYSLINDTDYDVGTCMRPLTTAISYTALGQLVIVLFAMVLIAIATCLLCCNSNKNQRE